MPKLKIDLPGGQHSVLLIHGLTGSPFEMKYLAERLNKAGFTVKVPCLPGHCTTVKDLSRTNRRDWYGSVREMFVELKRSSETVFVGGLCMGALLALQLAHEFGPDVSGLCLISTTLFFDGWALPWDGWLLPVVCRTPLRYVCSHTEKEPYGIKNEALRRRIAGFLKVNSTAYATTPVTSLHELLKLTREVKTQIPSITVPS
jgi:carboxylesterase